MKEPTKLTKENLKEIDTFDKLLNLRYGKKGTETRDKFEAGVAETLKESEEVCRNCKYFKLKEHYEDDLFKPNHKRGSCNSPKWAVRPEYYIDSDIHLESDMVEVTYSPNVGEDFGCKHFKY